MLRHPVTKTSLPSAAFSTTQDVMQQPEKNDYKRVTTKHRNQCTADLTSLIAARFIGSTCSIFFSRFTADLFRCSGTENNPATNNSSHCKF